MQANSPFLERLERGPLLCDGGMGTQIYARGISFERNFEQLNLTDAELIKAIHLDYVAAGAELIETNTFGANRYRLAEHGLENKVRALNRAGARIARDVRELCEQPVFIAGSIGPLGARLAPLGPIQRGAASDAFREQAEALLEAGIDLLMLETLSDMGEMRAALSAIRGITSLPIVALMTFGEDGTVSSGEDPVTAARIMRDLGADVVGVNCALGPADTFTVMSMMGSGQLEQIFFAAQPNAGLPRRVGNRFIYMSTPGYFADYVRRFLEIGVRLIGGCCGTTPQHIAAMSSVLREFAPEVTPATRPVPATPHLEIVQGREQEETGQKTRKYPTKFASLLAEGHFTVSTEMRAPRSVKTGRFLRNAAYLRDAGADLINITDNATARVRMNNIVAARLIQERVGIETIAHFTPRDRNLMGIQSDLIGAHASAIRNILAITGDPPTHGDFPNATGIWDVDSIGLIAILNNLNQGLDGMGHQLGSPSAFYIGCAAVPTADDVDLDLERLHRKIEAGAQFIMTQPVYDPANLFEYIERYRQRYGPWTIPLLAGLQPLHSYQQAERFHHEVPGIIIPDHVRERLREAGEASAQVGVEIIKEVFDAIYPSIQGVYIMPLDRYELVGELLPYIRMRTQRPEDKEHSV